MMKYTVNEYRLKKIFKYETQFIQCILHKPLFAFNWLQVLLDSIYCG